MAKVIFIIFSILILSGNVFASTLCSLNVVASADDVQRYVLDATEYCSITEGWACWGVIGTEPYSAGFRFRNVTIPQGYTIDSAFAGGRSEDNTSIDTVRALIYCEDVDSASSFTSSITNFDNRVKTTDKYTWIQVEDYVAGNWYRTPNIKAPIQEVINRAGWKSGNALVVLILNNNSDESALHGFFSYDYAEGEPYILIYYSAPATGGSKVMIK